MSERDKAMWHVLWGLEENVGPTVITVKDESTGLVRDEIYLDRNGELHRDDGPAVTRRHADGRMSEVSYYKHGELHRENGPASIDWNGEGVCCAICYYVDGKLHRDPAEGPAHWEKIEADNRWQEIYAWHGEDWRDPKEGPCLFERSFDGKETYSEEFCENFCSRPADAPRGWQPPPAKKLD